VSGRVLVVDDAAFMRSTLRDILGRGGFTVVAEAKNGREAVELYGIHLPDLVTMDIVMPELSGIDAVRIITKVHPKAKIIMCSAMGQQALVIEAIQAGARDFVIKPFQASRVIEAAVRALEP
jgi:two-component system chemotaxis response regulator CheY